MRKTLLAVTLVPVLTLGAAGIAQTRAQSTDVNVDAAAEGIVGTATVVNEKGENVGSASFRMAPSGMMIITASITGLTQGWHGFHVHETGKCEPAEGFKTAGGHLADGKEHGVLAEGGPHPGDLPNQMVQDDGILVTEVFSTALTEALLFDADGSAIMVHSGRDDYKSQPAGDAGSRVACGVIEKAGS